MSVPFEQSRALAALPGIRHGFFGRRGGISTGLYASLNASASTGDAADAVRRNRALAVAALGLPPEGLVTLKQVHSASVVTLTAAPDWSEPPEADAIVSNVPGLVLGILTADCAPILLADAEAGVVAAAHAGWKGAVAGIPAATVEAMIALGAHPRRIAASVGPTISQADYEVGPIFAADLLARHPSAGRHLARGRTGREHFDLPGFVFDALEATGIGAVDDLELCTYADGGTYFSHRRATHEGTTTGRQIALIGLG